MDVARRPSIKKHLHMNRMWLALTVVLLAASSSRADMGPFLPSTKFAKVINRVEIAEEQPDYVFVLYKDLVLYNGPTRHKQESIFVELKPGQPLEITGERRDTLELLIIPRAAAEKYSSAEGLSNAIRTEEFATWRHRFSTIATVPEWQKSEIVINYRVQPTSGGLEVVRTSWDPLWQWRTVVILLSLAVLLGGIWFVRRVWRTARRTAKAARKSANT